MRRLVRPALSTRADRVLRERTRRVTSSPDPAADAERLWRSRKNRAFDEIRAALRAMASGLERCMYCEDSEGTAIDHFRPKARWPERAFEWANYLLACSRCNSNEKRDEFPLDARGRPLLIDPSAEDPARHLVLSPSTGSLVPKTEKGVESARVFGLNRQLLVDGRRYAWVALRSLIVGYARLRGQGRDADADALEAAVRKYPFSSVLVWLLALPRQRRSLLAGGDVARAIRERPEIETWP